MSLEESTKSEERSTKGLLPLLSHFALRSLYLCGRRAIDKAQRRWSNRADSAAPYADREVPTQTGARNYADRRLFVLTGAGQPNNMVSHLGRRS